MSLPLSAPHSLPVVNPVTIYHCLLPLAKAYTNAIVARRNLAFCDKQRFMSSLPFLITIADLQTYGNRRIELLHKLNTIMAFIRDYICAAALV